MKLYTSEEAAEYISKHKYISNRMVRYYSDPSRRRIKGKLTGSGWIYTKADLDKYIKNLDS